MLRYVVRRVLMALLTLWLLSVGVFLAAQVLPGNPGRAVLGPAADQAAVNAFNERIGYDDPLLQRYVDWLGGAVTGDFGTSYVFGTDVGEMLADAAVNSLKLGGFALLIVIPLSLLGGIVAAVYRGRFVDRAITVGGMAASVVPEFVSGIVVLLVFGISLGVLPISATAPPGAGVGQTIEHLVLPALALTPALFGYIARVARAGTIAVLASDYTRTARLKGLSSWAVLRRHVLRNSMLPSVTVVATQIGYMVGGLVVIERLFNYRGLGLLIFNSSAKKDFPVLQASVLVIGALYMLLTLAADIVQTRLSPELRARVGASA